MYAGDSRQIINDLFFVTDNIYVHIQHVKMSATASGICDMLMKHKKSCLIVVVLIMVIVIMLIIWAHNCPPDSFIARWTSPDYKLLKKNHTDKARRSDSKEDTWNKADFIKSVTEFNKKAAVSS